MPLRARAVLVWLAMLTAIVSAQTSKAPAIEVVSVKPSTARGGLFIEPGGRFVATGIQARILLTLAFGQPGMGLRLDQMEGAPSWLNTATFDVTIKAENPADLPVRNVLRSPDLPAFLRVLLADRFRLVAHMETREMPVYALVRRDATRLGPDVHPSSIDCLTQGCGITLSRDCLAASCLHDVGVTIDQFAYDLRRSPQVDRPVVNRTGLGGRYELIVHWLAPTSAAARAAGVPEINPADEVSIFSSMQDRLGLKLEPTTGPVDVLVIDHIERPTEN